MERCTSNVYHRKSKSKQRGQWNDDVFTELLWKKVPSMLLAYLLLFVTSTIPFVFSLSLYRTLPCDVVGMIPREDVFHMEGLSAERYSLWDIFALEVIFPFRRMSREHKRQGKNLLSTNNVKICKTTENVEVELPPPPATTTPTPTLAIRLLILIANTKPKH